MFFLLADLRQEVAELGKIYATAGPQAEPDIMDPVSTYDQLMILESKMSNLDSRQHLVG